MSGNIHGVTTLKRHTSYVVYSVSKFLQKSSVTPKVLIRERTLSM